MTRSRLATAATTEAPPGEPCETQAHQQPRARLGDRLAGAVAPTLPGAVVHDAIRRANQREGPRIDLGVLRPVVPVEFAAAEAAVAVPRVGDAVDEEPEAEVEDREGEARDLGLEHLHDGKPGGRQGFVEGHLEGVAGTVLKLEYDDGEVRSGSDAGLDRNRSGRRGQQQQDQQGLQERGAGASVHASRFLGRPTGSECPRDGSEASSSWVSNDGLPRRPVSRGPSHCMQQAGLPAQDPLPVAFPQPCCSGLRPEAPTLHGGASAVESESNGGS